MGWATRDAPIVAKVVWGKYLPQVSDLAGRNLPARSPARCNHNGLQPNHSKNRFLRWGKSSKCPILRHFVR